MLAAPVDSSKKVDPSTGWLKRIFPFNAEQSINILSEFGPLVTLFVVNAIGGIEAGTWALLISTVVAMVTMRLVVGRLPVFPVIASGVTIVFGGLTLLTGDAMWVQIKVTIFNAMFAGFLFGGLASSKGKLRGRAALSTLAIVIAGIVWLGNGLFMAQPTGDLSLLVRQLSSVPIDLVIPQALPTNALSVASVLVGFLIGLFLFGRNFFQYSFEKTFHYTEEGWSNFTFSFAWFFVLTAVLNEVVRQTFVDSQMYDVLGYRMDGVNVWIAFKLVVIMPLSGVFAWYLTRILQAYRMPDGDAAE